MVVSRDELFGGDVWNGLRAENSNRYLKIIRAKYKFLSRGEVEDDPRYKQIIPYLVFENEGLIFVMQRKGSHTDRRLASKISIGVGGHINKQDVKSNDPVDWARREFEEEIEYGGKLKTEFLGILNHDANDVGLVHVGLVFKVIGDSADIKIRDEHKEGRLMTMAELGKQYKAMETWSQIVYDFLMIKKQSSKETKRQMGQNGKKQRSSSFAQELRRDANRVSGILPDHFYFYIDK